MATTLIFKQGDNWWMAIANTDVKVGFLNYEKAVEFSRAMGAGMETLCHFIISQHPPPFRVVVTESEADLFLETYIIRSSRLIVGGEEVFACAAGRTLLEDVVAAGERFLARMALLA